MKQGAKNVSEMAEFLAIQRFGFLYGCAVRAVRLRAESIPEKSFKAIPQIVYQM